MNEYRTMANKIKEQVFAIVKESPDISEMEILDRVRADNGITDDGDDSICYGHVHESLKILKRRLTRWQDGEVVIELGETELEVHGPNFCYRVKEP